MKLSVVILAAGKGSRMKSAMPKVLHKIADKPMLEHVIASAQALRADQIFVVYGHGGDEVKNSLTAYPEIRYVEQKEQLGTGHAVLQALPHIADADRVLVLYGDVPLTPLPTLRGLLEDYPENGLSFLTAVADDPSNYGRVIRNIRNQVMAIVEQIDASPAQLAIREVNSGILYASAASLKHWLGKADSNNAQGEIYLTDCIRIASDEALPVHAVIASEEWQVAGVNNRAQQAALERVYQTNLARSLMDEGVGLIDPARIDIRGSLKAGIDTTIDVNCVFGGRVEIGKDCYIGANCVIRDSVIGDHVVIKPNTVIEQAALGNDCTVGPFARLRPGTELLGDSHIGNFVEVKKSIIGKRSKVNHLSYVGDTEVGDRVNIGAGTITCNYDGANKHQTIIEDDVFVGSNSQLIAPVRIGAGATIGAGSTVCTDVNPQKLVLSRVRQREINDWKRPAKRDPVIVNGRV